MATKHHNLQKLFVYGTLKRGQPNNSYMSRAPRGHSEFLSGGLTRDTYPLVIATKWNLPFLLDIQNSGKKIIGDIYEVDEDFLEWMDEFEGHPTLYRRKKINVYPGEKSELMGCYEEMKALECWTYFLPNYPKDILKFPLYSNYDCYGAHNRKYLSSTDNSDRETLEEELKKELAPYI